MTLSSILLKFVSVVFITVFLHWALVNVYVYFCCPPTVFGALKTFISLGSPLCNTINLVQYEVAKHYITIWTGAGIATVAWVIKALTTTQNNIINK